MEKIREKKKTHRCKELEGATATASSCGPVTEVQQGEKPSGRANTPGDISGCKGGAWEPETKYTVPYQTHLVLQEFSSLLTGLPLPKEGGHPPV